MTYPASTDLDGAGDASVILEAALLARHCGVAATKLCDLQVFTVLHSLPATKSLLLELPSQNTLIFQLFVVVDPRTNDSVASSVQVQLMSM